MKTIFISIFSILISIACFANTDSSNFYFRPSINYTYRQQSELSGINFTNKFEFHKNAHSINFGFNFSKAWGNRGIVLSDYDSLSFLHNSNEIDIPIFYGLKRLAQTPFHMESPIAKSFSMGVEINYAYNLPFDRVSIEISCGLYGSYVSSIYMLGIYEDCETEFYLSDYYIYGGKGNFDIAFPVYLRYINVGFTTGLTLTPFPDMKNPIGINLQYYYGRYQSGSFNAGVSLKINNQ
jgi:hypothetical protein